MPIIFEQFLLYIRYAVRRRWTVLTFAWLFCVLGWVVVIFLPNNYQSEARVYADTDSLLTPLVTGLAPERQSANQLDALEETLLSRTNLEVVVKRSRFEPDPTRIEAAVSTLASTISIDSEGGNLFIISYRNRDPFMAHAVVASLLETVLEDDLVSDREDVGPAQAFLQQQLERKRNELSGAETALAAFQKRNVDILAGQSEYLRSLSAARDRLEQLRADLSAAQARQGDLESRIERTPKTVNPSGLAGQGLREGSPEAQLEALNQRLIDLRNRFTDQHPDVIATERAIGSLEARIQSGGATRLTGVANPLVAELRTLLVETETEIASLYDRVRQAQLQVDRQDLRARELPEAQGELKRLTSQYEITKRQYDDLQERRESARIVGDLGGRSELFDFRVIDPANRPLQPASPQRFAMMLGVLVIGLGIGLATAIGAGVVQNPFESTRTLQEIYGLQVLGSVTRVVPPDRQTANRIAHVGFAAGCVALIVLFIIIIQAENSGLFAPLRDDPNQPQQFAEVR